MSSPTSSELEFELMSLHPSIYPQLLPIDRSKIRLVPIQQSKWPPSPLGELVSGSPPPSESQKLVSTASQKHLTSNNGPEATQGYAPYPIKGESAESTSLTMGPHRPQPLCDARLHQLQIGYWTRIPISDDFAACVISSYLVRDHRMLGLFDADLFISDLVERRLEFCSPFLLSSLMYYACVSPDPVLPLKCEGNLSSSEW
jgi:hypothetical protein